MANESLSAGVACALEIRREYELIPAVSCSACFALGLIFCFCGQRWCRLVMLLSGLALGSGVGLLLVLQERLDTHTRAAVSLGLGLLLGLLLGLVALLVPSVGLFLTGLQLGSLLSGAALLLLGQYYPVLSPAWVPVGAVLGASVSCAVLSLCWRKAMTVAATAALGSALAVAGVDYWVETPVLLFRAYEGLQTRQGLCWFSWGMIGVWPVLGALGTLVQCRITAADGKQKQLDLRRVRRLEGTCPRRPPVLQRYTGDMLAPSYLASLRERQNNTGSSLWSLTSVQHIMIDFDSETGSLVPLTTSASALLRL